MHIMLVGFLLSTIPENTAVIFHLDNKYAVRRIGQSIGSLGKIESIKGETVFISHKDHIIQMRPGEDNGEDFDTPAELIDDEISIDPPESYPEENESVCTPEPQSSDDLF